MGVFPRPGFFWFVFLPVKKMNNTPSKMFQPHLLSRRDTRPHPTLADWNCPLYETLNFFEMLRIRDLHFEGRRPAGRMRGGEQFRQSAELRHSGTATLPLYRWPSASSRAPSTVFSAVVSTSPVKRTTTRSPSSMFPNSTQRRILRSCREIRKEFDTPVIMLSARQEEYDKLPTTYMGVTRRVTKKAQKRVGVFKISEFYEKLIM